MRCYSVLSWTVATRFFTPPPQPSPASRGRGILNCQQPLGFSNAVIHAVGQALPYKGFFCGRLRYASGFGRNTMISFVGWVSEARATGTARAARDPTCQKPNISRCWVTATPNPTYKAAKKTPDCPAFGESGRLVTGQCRRVRPGKRPGVLHGRRTKSRLFLPRPARPARRNRTSSAHGRLWPRC